MFKKLKLKVPEELKQEIIHFALNEEKLFVINALGPGRRYCNLNTIDHPLNLKLKEFSKYCFGTYGIDVIEEPLYGNMIGVNSENAFVHPHQDKRSESGLWHLRMNFLLRKPIDGGFPVIAGVGYTIKEDTGWLMYASEYLHWSTPVVGDKPRIILSMGSYVEEEKAKSIISV
jgi:hypothetical protein